MKKSKKIEKYILIVIFIAFLFLVGVGTVINSIDSYKRAIKEGGRIEAWNIDYDIDSNMKVNILGKTHFINLQGLIARVINQPMLNDVVKLDNGCLTSLQPQFSDGVLQNDIAELLKLQEISNENGADFLFILAPMKMCRNDAQLPTGLEDYSRVNAETFLGYVNEQNMKYIDIEDEWHKQDINHYEMFFETDHHWKPKCGISVAQMISEFLTNEYGYAFDKELFNIDNYNVETYEKFHLGSLGQRVGRYYGSDVDDIDKIYPKWETHITNVDEKESGTFEDVLLDSSVLEKRDYSQRLVYDTLYGKASYHHIHNDDAINKKKMLIQTDSMGSVVVPYLTLLYSDVYWNYVTEDAILEIKPDIVIVMLYENNLQYYAN